MAKRKARRISKPQPEQNVLFFKATGTQKHLDLPAALSAVNRKQYHQTRKLKPLAYHVRAQAVDLASGTIKFSTAANTWTTKNALTMFGAKYRAHLKMNGIKVSDLYTYAREIRYALTTAETGYSHSSGGDGYSGTPGLTAEFPSDWSEATLMADYDLSDGSTLSNAYQYSNELTMVSLPEAEADGEPETIVPGITGASDHDNNKIAVIPEYLNTRRNRPDEERESIALPDDTSLMGRLGSSQDEHFDEAILALEKIGEYKPYNEAGANMLVPQGFLGGLGDYTSFVAPCGLIQVDCADNAEYLITVSAITEM